MPDQIRPLKPRAQLTAVAMLRRAWTDTYAAALPRLLGPMRRDNLRNLEQWLAGLMSTPGYVVLVAGPPDAPTGLCGFYPLRPGWFEIDFLYLAPGHRSRGLGKALLDAPLNQIEARGARARLWAFVHNTRAVAWYKRQGFVPAQRRPSFSWNGVRNPLVEMRLPRRTDPQ